jgi:Phosphotransferase enzyme family
MTWVQTVPELRYVPEPFRSAVDSALEEVRRLAPRYLSPASPCSAELRMVDERSHSFVGTIELRGPGGDRRFYLKTLRTHPARLGVKRTELEQEYALLEELELRFAPYPDLGVVKPVRCWPESYSMLTEEFAGETVERLLVRARGVPSPRAVAQGSAVCRRVGRWLALFQGFMKPASSDSFDPAEIVAYCARRLRLLEEARKVGFAVTIPAGLLGRVEQLAVGIGAGDLVAVGRHNDFRPDNMVTDGNRVAVLDFTGFTFGPALYDFMKFHMKLEDFTRGVSLRPRAVAHWQTAFQEGYGSPVDLGSPLARLLRVANNLDKMSELAMRHRSAKWSPVRQRHARDGRTRLEEIGRVLAGGNIR